LKTKFVQVFRLTDFRFGVGNGFGTRFLTFLFMLSISANPVSESNFFSGLAKKKSSPIFKYKLKTTIRSSFQIERIPFRCGNWFRNPGLNLFGLVFGFRQSYFKEQFVFKSVVNKTKSVRFLFRWFRQILSNSGLVFFKAKLIFPIFQIQEFQNQFF
jgi:hypothetical protein